MKKEFCYIPKDKISFSLNMFTKIIAASCATLILSPFAHAQNNAFTFNEAFLRMNSENEIDVSRFKFGNPVEPGSYLVDVWLNHKFLTKDIIQVEKEDDGQSVICLNFSLINQLGLKDEVLDSAVLKNLQLGQQQCATLSSLNAQIQSRFNYADQRFDVEAPQAVLKRTARGSVNPSLWDNGVPSMLMGYDANYYESVNGNTEYQSFYAGTRFGLNYESWRFRHQGTLNWNKDSRRSYKAIRTYLERDLVPIKSKITLGDAFTDGQIFDSFSFRGVQMRTDESMWPESQRGYAPVVRGIAQTNARVEVWQNGVQLYNTTVNPGAFEIDDLYPTGYGGDLEIQVHEANGEINTFTVPYASVTQLLRPGMLRYNATVGRLRDTYPDDNDYVAQGTVQYGLDNGLTLYGGILTAHNYASSAIGSSFDTPLGAFAGDFTGTRAWSKGVDREGGSLRLTYSKFINSTHSNVSVAAYRFSSSGYLDLANAMKFNHYYRSKPDEPLYLERQKSRLSLTLDQGLADGWGHLYASGYIQNYWDRNGTDSTYQLGYNNNYKSLSYGVSASRYRNVEGNDETQYLLSFSVPLGSSSGAPSFNMETAYEEGSGISNRANISGQSGAGKQIAWNIGATRDVDDNNAVNGSATYRSAFTTLKGSASRSENYRSVSAGMSGTAVLVAEGVALSPYTTETMAIVHAPGAQGAKVSSYPGVEVNRWGLAVVPYLRPYNFNNVVIDPQGLPDTVELQNSSQKVAPTTGSVVRVDFSTLKGNSVLVGASDKEGNRLPFGAIVTDLSGKTIGMVMQGGKVYARLPDGETSMIVKLGNKNKQSCTINLGAALFNTGNTGIKNILAQRCQ